MAERARPEARGSRSRVVAIVVVWVVVMVVTCLASGCYGRNCEGITTFYGRIPGEGRLLTPDTWESSPVDGTWLDFPQQRAWIFDLQALGDREPQIIIPYVSAQQSPLAEDGNFTIAGGNLAEISAARRGAVIIKNGTCADYYLRLVVTTAPRTPNASFPAGPSPEAGADAAGADGGN